MIKMATLFFAFSLMLVSTQVGAAAALKPKKSKNIKSLARQVQKAAPDDTYFFDQAFPAEEDAKQNEKNTGSLWVDTYSSNLFKNLNRAARVGDMVTIIIDEEATGSKTAETRTQRKAEHKLGINGLFGLVGKLTSLISGFDASKAIDVEHENQLNGRGETKRKGSLEAKITARVIKVLRNGDMMIRGQKNIRVNGEEQSLIVEGFIRPYDISSENMINSNYIADARITYSGFGTVSDKQKPGWLTRILDHILPF